MTTACQDMYTDCMQFDKRLPFLVLSFVLIAVWMSIPWLEQYSLQLVALSLLVFLALRFKHNRENLTQLIPKKGSSELIPVTIVFMLFISATGNTHSWVYPLTYVYLVMIIFSLEKKTAGILALCTFLLQAFLVNTFTVQESIILLNIPVISGVLLFAKQQYEKAQIEEQLLVEEESQLASSLLENTALESYIQEFLLPKTEVLASLEQPETELEKTLHSQISLIITESKKILERSKK